MFFNLVLVDVMGFLVMDAVLTARDSALALQKF